MRRSWRLVQEARIGDLFKGAGDKDYEASGVYLKDGYLHIIFDDNPRLLRIRPDWHQEGEEPVLLDLKGTGAGYEDITYQSSTRRWYCLIEAAETKSGVSMPRIDEFDESFTFIKGHWLDFPLKAGNKGFEGLSTLHYSGNDYLLGLCEGNDCKSGKSGAHPGNGRIQVFTLGVGTMGACRHHQAPGSGAVQGLRQPRCPQRFSLGDLAVFVGHVGRAAFVRSRPVWTICSKTMARCICSPATIKVGSCTAIWKG